MRIGIEAQRLFRGRKHGMDIVVLELIKNLQIIDKENEYVIFTKEGDDNQCISETDNFEIVKTRAYTYPVWEQLVLPYYVKNKKIDLLHCTSNTAPYFLNVPIILTLHDIIFLYKNEKLRNGGSLYQVFGNIYRRFLVPRIISKCQLIITVSTYAKFEIQKYFDLKSQQLLKIHNGISSYFTKPLNSSQQEEIKREFNLPEKFLLFLGNTSAKKNLSGVLLAYAKYLDSEIRDQYPLVIVDLSEKDLMINLKQLKIESIRKSILLVGYVDQQQLCGFYTMAEIFLYPSLEESFGLPILEAMACETPVITSNTSSMPEISGDAALLVDPFQPLAIANGIKRLLNDRKKCLSLIDNGVKRVNDFSFLKMAEKVLTQYNSIFEQRILK